MVAILQTLPMCFIERKYSVKSLLKFVLKNPFNKSELVWAISWPQPGNKPLSKPIKNNFIDTHTHHWASMSEGIIYRVLLVRTTLRCLLWHINNANVKGIASATLDVPGLGSTPELELELGSTPTPTPELELELELKPPEFGVGVDIQETCRSWSWSWNSRSWSWSWYSRDLPELELELKLPELELELELKLSGVGVGIGVEILSSFFLYIHVHIFKYYLKHITLKLCPSYYAY